MFVHCCLFSEKLTTMLENTVCSLQSNNSKKFARAKIPAKMARARVEQKDDRKKESWLLRREASDLNKKILHCAVRKYFITKPDCTMEQGRLELNGLRDSLSS